jgi:uncharacterized protein with von Willebrand factor type A (vWA) domain
MILEDEVYYSKYSLNLSNNKIIDCNYIKCFDKNDIYLQFENNFIKTNNKIIEETDIIIILDCSGSMSGSRIRKSNELIDLLKINE